MPKESRTWKLDLSRPGQRISCEFRNSLGCGDFELPESDFADADLQERTPAP